MNEREVAERVLELCRSADHVRMPDHRRTAEQFLAARDHLRDELRKFYRDLTGRWPEGGASEPPPRRSAKLPVPTALMRDRERRRFAAV